MINKNSTYDAVPYRGTSVRNTTPTHLVLSSRWHAGPSSNAQPFHLAELGCGDAANLLSLAFYYPASRFIGVDNSLGELEKAKEGVRSLGLMNIDFLKKDVRDLGPADVEPCNYIIAHGLYSWVPEDARDSILSFCHQSLAPSGLAYISYNAQPGWAIRRLVRETLLRSRLVREAVVEDKATKAIEVAAQLLEDLPSRDYAHAVQLADELERVRDGKPFYVFHEHLAEVNDGFWLGEFVERARQHGLEYVADAQFCRWEGHVPAELKAALAKRDLNPIEQEETADLLGDRSFRASILCRADAPRTSASHQELLEEAYIATSLSAESDPFDVREGVVERFIGTGLVGKNTPEVTLDTSITKAAVVSLASQWPFGMQFQALYDHAVNLLATHGCDAPSGARSQLIDELTILFEAGQIDLRLEGLSYSSDVPEHPQAHALARYESEHREALTTPYHLPLPFEPKALAFVGALDGLRSQTELQQFFGKELVERTLPVLGRWGLLE